MKVKVWCEDCCGSGKVWDTWGISRTCLLCNGKGYVEKDLYELDSHQSLPNHEWGKAFELIETAVCNVVQIAMLKAGFRKVKL